MYHRDAELSRNSGRNRFLRSNTPRASQKTVFWMWVASEWVWPRGKLAFLRESTRTFRKTGLLRSAPRSAGEQDISADSCLAWIAGIVVAGIMHVRHIRFAEISAPG